MGYLRSACLVLGLAIAPALCSAGFPALRIPYLADMRRDAIESVSLTFGPITLWLASKVIGDDDPESAAIKKLIRGLRKVQIRHYRFRTDHVYQPSELQGLRRQLSAPGWHQMVQVHDHGMKGDVDVYYALDDRTVTALAILSAAPREFTVVNISGHIDLEQVALLRHTFVPNEPVQ